MVDDTKPSISLYRNKNMGDGLYVMNMNNLFSDRLAGFMGRMADKGVVLHHKKEVSEKVAHWYTEIVDEEIFRVAALGAGIHINEHIATATF